MRGGTCMVRPKVTGWTASASAATPAPELQDQRLDRLPGPVTALCAEISSPRTTTPPALQNFPDRPARLLPDSSAVQSVHLVHYFSDRGRSRAARTSATGAWVPWVVPRPGRLLLKKWTEQVKLCRIPPVFEPRRVQTLRSHRCLDTDSKWIRRARCRAQKEPRNHPAHAPHRTDFEVRVETRRVCA